MKVYIANFGQGNYAWPECLARQTVATMNPDILHSFWIAGKKESYIDYSIKNIKTAAGLVPTRPVAARWYNLATVIAETNGDLWIHRERDQIWWTISTVDPVAFDSIHDPLRAKDGMSVIACHKPCQPWSDSNRRGGKLLWRALHPRAREFLFTEGTLQQLSEENADYAIALIEGNDLEPWHSLLEWKRKTESGRNPGKILNPAELAAEIMARTVVQTVKYANGQEVVQTVKNKELRIPELLLSKYILSLIESQERLCAVSGLELAFPPEPADSERLCSLDRIDSDGHYEEGNLQVVCKFINRWKGSSDDTTFRRLINLVQTSDLLVRS